MKKIMWIAAMIPVVVTSVVLQFMPDVIPMHHDLEGKKDEKNNVDSRNNSSCSHKCGATVYAECYTYAS